MRVFYNLIRILRQAYKMIFQDDYSDAKAYETIVRTFSGRGVLVRHIADLFENFLPLHKDGGVEEHPYILDLGAGSGIISRELDRRGYRVCANDISPAVLEHLRLEAPHIERSIFDFNQQFPFDDSVFDGVTTVWANRYITRDGLFVFLSEIRRVLKVGGIFLWPIFPADTILWKMKNGSAQVTGADDLVVLVKECDFSHAEILRDLFYKNIFSFKLPPHTVPIYIFARK